MLKTYSCPQFNYILKINPAKAVNLSLRIGFKHTVVAGLLMGCIYKITNKVNGKFYIGSSVNGYARKQVHFSKLRNNKHDNAHFQNSFNKYGESAFVFSIIEDVDAALLQERELFYLQSLKPHYNISTESIRPNAGRKFTATHRRNLSLARGGDGILREERIKVKQPLTQEQKVRMNAHKFGRKFSKKTRKLLSKKAKARKWSKIVREKISASLKKRFTVPTQG